MQEFILTGFLGIVLIAICCLCLYEALRHVWGKLPGLNRAPRLHVVTVIAFIFSAHVLNIWLFGVVYYVLHNFDLGTLTGGAIEHGRYTLDLFGCIYFSAVIYSTLGLGDITPIGALRMITGVEALTGFILMGWTVSFTYIAMQKFWELPHGRPKQ